MSNANSDLVGRLMKDEKEVWDKLLKNTFCLWMATAKREDERETKGFKWYMIVSLRFSSLTDLSSLMNVHSKIFFTAPIS